MKAREVKTDYAYVPFITFYDYLLTQRRKDSFDSFLQVLISLASFIQILFIYKWHARKFNVSFLAYDITI